MHYNENQNLKMMMHQNNVHTTRSNGVQFTMTDNSGSLCVNCKTHQKLKLENDELQKLNNENVDEISALKDEASKFKADEVSDLERTKMKYEQELKESDKKNDEFKVLMSKLENSVYSK